MVCPLHGPRPHDGPRCQVQVLDEAGDRVPCGFALLGSDRQPSAWRELPGQLPEVRERPRLRGAQVDCVVSGVAKGLDDAEIARELREEIHLDITEAEVTRLLNAARGR